MPEANDDGGLGPRTDRDPRVDAATRRAREAAQTAVGLGVIYYQRYAAYRRRIGRPLPGREQMQVRARSLGRALRRLDARIDEPRDHFVASLRQRLPSPADQILVDVHEVTSTWRRRVVDRLDPPSPEERR